MAFILVFSLLIVSLKSTNEGLFSLNELRGKVFLNKREMNMLKEGNPNKEVLIF